MNSEFANLLYAGALPKLGHAVYFEGGLKKWIAGGAYDPQISPSGDVLLGRVSIDDFKKAASFDYDRFALAAQESRLVALSEREKFGVVSWPLLKQYYSAFFSAHAIMRARGAGVVRIDSNQSTAVTSIIQSYLGNSVKLLPGNYYYSTLKGANDGSGEFTISFSASKDGKGAHEGFWNHFVKYLESEAARAVQIGLPDNKDFVLFALQVKNAVMLGDKVWLSTIRNEINYQHEHQSWMPLTKRSLSNKAVPKSTGSYSSFSRIDIARGADPVRAFFCVCCFLSELNLEVASRVAKRSTAGGSFGQRWTRLVQLTTAND